MLIPNSLFIPYFLVHDATDSTVVGHSHYKDEKDKSPHHPGPQLIGTKG